MTETDRQTGKRYTRLFVEAMQDTYVLGRKTGWSYKEINTMPRRERRQYVKMIEKEQEELEKEQEKAQRKADRAQQKV